MGSVWGFARKVLVVVGLALLSVLVIWKPGVVWEGVEGLAQSVGQQVGLLAQVLVVVLLVSGLGWVVGKVWGK